MEFFQDWPGLVFIQVPPPFLFWRLPIHHAQLSQSSCHHLYFYLWQLVPMFSSAQCLVVRKYLLLQVHKVVTVTAHNCLSLSYFGTNSTVLIFLSLNTVISGTNNAYTFRFSSSIIFHPQSFVFEFIAAPGEKVKLQLKVHFQMLVPVQTGQMQQVLQDKQQNKSIVCKNFFVEGAATVSMSFNMIL